MSSKADRNAGGGCLRKAIAAAALAVACAPALVTAQPFKYEKHEVAALPTYCFVRMENPHSTEWAYWMKRLGPTGQHIHHYCRGLVYTNRILFNSAQKREREEYLKRSLQEFDYVISRSPRHFVLLPEILTKKGENALKLNLVNEGMNALTDAIQIKPDYWPPYAALSDHYKRVGDVKKARELLEKALSFAPETHALRTRLAALDGKSPPPPPPPKAKAPEEAKPSAEPKPASELAPDKTAQPAEK